MKNKFLAVLALGFLAGPMAANAGFIGQTVEATAFFPTLGGATTGGPVTAVVGAGFEFSDGDFLPFFGPSFDFADASIAITHASTAHTPATFNGYQFFDINGTIDSILSVSILGDNTGFFSGDLSRITWDANNIWINFESLNFAGIEGARIDLGVTFASTVPEPGTLALLGLGLLGLGFSKWRKSA